MRIVRLADHKTMDVENGYGLRMIEQGQAVLYRRGQTEEKAEKTEKKGK